MKFYSNMKRLYSVLTNGIVTFEIQSSRHGCGIAMDDLGSHIFGYDGTGNMYIDGVLAHVEIRCEEGVPC